MPRMMRKAISYVLGFFAVAYGLKLLGKIFDVPFLTDAEHGLLKLALWWLP